MWAEKFGKCNDNNPKPGFEKLNLSVYLMIESGIKFLRNSGLQRAGKRN